MFIISYLKGSQTLVETAAVHGEPAGVVVHPQII